MDEQELEPLEGDERDVWATIFMGEVVRGSDDFSDIRVMRAVDLAEKATKAFRDRMAVGRGAMLLGRPSEEAANATCAGA